MIVAIGSTRKPKIKGVKSAIKNISKIFNLKFNEIHFIEIETKSNVSDTPLSIEELIVGGKTRAKKSYEQIIEKSKIKIGIGVEGGVFKIGDKGFLQSWSVVYDGKNYFCGASSAIELPNELMKQLFVYKKDLGKIIDKFSNKKNVRSNQGTWGILTNDFYSREDSFADSTFNALIPLFNNKLYKKKL